MSTKNKIMLIYDDIQQVASLNLNTLTKFLNSLERNKKLLCRAHTQVYFSYNHTTTQRGEGYNDRLKGHGTLKKVLSDASLPAFIDRVDAIALDTNHKSIDILTKVRTANERVTPAYKEEVEASLKLSKTLMGRSLLVRGLLVNSSMWI